MVNLYKCEKCGKVSDNYDEINACEERHFSVVRGWSPEKELQDTLEGMTEYKEGQAEPNIVHLLFTRSYWDGSEWKDEKRCGKFKLISSYDAPLVIENE